MKKSLTVLALALGATGAFAQDLTSKKGEQILPEAKDWAIGIDANPFLNYMGNFFGKNANNVAPTFNFLNYNQTITGKYFLTANTALRASLRIGHGSQTQKQMVTDRFHDSVMVFTPPPNSYPNANQQVENSWKHSNTNIGLAFGIEKRKGKTRLQGYYGGELGFNVSSSKDVFTYGNKLNPRTAQSNTANPAVVVNTDDSFGGAGNVVTVPSDGVVGSGRITKRKNGTTFSVGARVFIGVEYFILPKISLGGEFGWGLAVQAVGKATTTIESIGKDGTPNSEATVGTTTTKTSNGSAVSLDTDNLNSIFGPSASLRLNFHF